MWVHHGDCVGADSQFHDLVQETLPSCQICVHPPTGPNFRAFRNGDFTQPRFGYIIRDHDIALHGRLLIAAPKLDREERSSGTWITIRFARKLGRPIHIVYPNIDTVYNWPEYDSTERGSVS